MGNAIVGFFKSIWSKFKGPAANFLRDSTKAFIAAYQDDALRIVMSLASVNGVSSFKQWEEEAFAQVRSLSATAPDTAVRIAVLTAFDQVKFLKGA